jgi:methylated-DNA-[protein]-cysteine S-methyltransferase
MLIRHMSHCLPLFIDRFDTPIGEMLIVTDLEGHLRAVDWADHETRMNRLLRVHYALTDLASIRRALRMV